MAERLSISMLKKHVEAYNETIEIPIIADGKEFNVKLKPFISPTLARDIVNDLANFFYNADKEKVKVADNEHDDLVGYFILKYCSDIKFSKSKKAKILYEEFKVLLETDLFKVLIDFIPEESIKRVYNRIEEVLDVSSKYEEKMALLQDKAKSLKG
jgi:hypothetical protein